MTCEKDQYSPKQTHAVMPCPLLHSTPSNPETSPVTKATATPLTYNVNLHSNTLCAQRGLLQALLPTRTYTNTLGFFVFSCTFQVHGIVWEHIILRFKPELYRDDTELHQVPLTHDHSYTSTPAFIRLINEEPIKSEWLNEWMKWRLRDNIVSQNRQTSSPSSSETSRTSVMVSGTFSLCFSVTVWQETNRLALSNKFMPFW